MRRFGESGTITVDYYRRLGDASILLLLRIARQQNLPAQ